MRWFRAIPVLSVLLLLPGCGSLKGDKGKPEMTGNPFGPTGVPPDLRVGHNGEAVKPGGNAPTEAQKRAMESYNPDELVWTDPDNPDAELPELDGLLDAPKQKGPWWDSETEAVRESKRTGKPLLIWFTDTQRSPASKALSENLLSRKDFEEWAEANTVRLVVDQTVAKNIDDNVAKQIHVRDLKKKYKASGFPSLHVLAPSGEVIGRYKGYRPGQEDFLWGQLKQGVGLAKERQQSWKASLEKKGYRDWSNDSGKVIFAKLEAYKDGHMIIVEPDGQRVRTEEKHLSSGDRAWIRQQKDLRGMQ
jgi:thioredoxin-related protein